ncbi:MAG: hypothetical protein BAJALOKI2v1_410023 [Promethearchaeota archaeon]|nr:MAG: hypothetical protein BAJALOKI2v1_410023 [Candidatus Lokiarchaeota archaeon]
MVKIRDLKIGNEFRSEFDQITPELIRKYSKLGGFAKLASNVIHDNEILAKEAGYKGVIAHGLFSFGFIVKLLDDFIQREKYGKLIKVGVEMRNPVYCGDILVSKAKINKIEKKRVYFEITQKTLSKVCIKKDGKIIKKFRGDKNDLISEEETGYDQIKEQKVQEGILIFRERINSLGDAIVELFE